ncbi:MAG TPA: hypothetical protein ACFYEF_14765 [Candidatus Wunengus sp. YC63]
MANNFSFLENLDEDNFKQVYYTPLKGVEASPPDIIITDEDVCPTN